MGRALRASPTEWYVVPVYHTDARREKQFIKKSLTVSGSQTITSSSSSSSSAFSGKKYFPEKLSSEFLPEIQSKVSLSELTFDCESVCDHSPPTSELTEEDQTRVMHCLTSQKCEKNSKPLFGEKQNGNIGSIPEGYEAMDMKDSIMGLENCPPYAIPVSNIKLSEKGSALYIDKNGIEHKLPEIIFCLKEGSYHLVKNVCMDGEMPSLEKISLENVYIDHIAISNSSTPGLGADSDSSRGAADVAAATADGEKLLKECDSGIDVATNCSSNNMTEKKEVSLDSKSKFMDGIIDEKVVPHKVTSVQELVTENSSSNPSNFDGGEPQHQSDQDTSKETKLENPESTPAAEELNNNEVFSDSKMESKSIPSDSEFLPSAKNKNEEDLQNESNQIFAQTSSSRSLEVGILDDRKTLSQRYYATKHVRGESDFSEVSVLSLGAHLGTIPYSGNISFRSDSSATSTRSFAFPILNSEWNSSPIKMMKADKRGYRKSRGCLRSFLCFKV
ncbi:hypothetical protein GIB67_001786 [Kingdonia uniflora]|uniref:Uncharacterized protein n=1 Tax=Kingdonia uniflora TaxID=39325 RepID=A0A7J7LBP0_9MAGN|nr:hypothetical protein GIB67_001786 [Kingdonia uniflora]